MGNDLIGLYNLLKTDDFWQPESVRKISEDVTVMPDEAGSGVLSGDTAEFTHSKEVEPQDPEPAAAPVKREEPKPARLTEAGSFEGKGALSASEVFKDRPDVLPKNAPALSTKYTMQILKDLNLINDGMKNLAGENDALFKTAIGDDERQFYKAVDDKGTVKIISTNMKDGRTSIKVYKTDIKREMPPKKPVKTAAKTGAPKTETKKPQTEKKAAEKPAASKQTNVNPPAEKKAPVPAGHLTEAGSFEGKGALSASEVFKDRPDVLPKNAPALSTKYTMQILKDLNLINDGMKNLAGENDALFKTAIGDDERQFYKAVDDKGTVKIISTNMKNGRTSIKVYNTDIKIENKKKESVKAAVKPAPKKPEIHYYECTGRENIEKFEDGGACITIEPNEYGGKTEIYTDEKNRKTDETITRKNGSKELIHYEDGVIAYKCLSEKNGRVTDSYFVNGKLHQEIIKDKNKETEKLYDKGVYKGRIEITPYNGKGSVGRISRYRAFDGNGRRIEASKLQWDDKHACAGTPAEIYRRYWQRYFPKHNIDIKKNKDNTITIAAKQRTAYTRIDYYLTINKNGSFKGFKQDIAAWDEPDTGVQSNAGEISANRTGDAANFAGQNAVPASYSAYPAASSAQYAAAENFNTPNDDPLSPENTAKRRAVDFRELKKQKEQRRAGII